MNRIARTIALVGAAAMFAAGAGHAEEPHSIRIGYAVSMTGPNAVGGAAWLVADYRMWVDEVNAAGGILLKGIGRRLPIEVVAYDDKSNADESLRAVERMIREDKLDFILAPWGTGLNIRVGPLFHDAGYPQLAVHAITDRAVELTKQWPNSFWMLGTSRDCVQAVARVLTALRAQGRIGERIATVNVADQLGIEFATAARSVLRKAGFRLVYERAYPVDQQDMRPMLGGAMKLAPDALLAFSYPPDTMLITDQALALGFNPKVFYTAIASGTPFFKQRFGSNADGVMGMDLGGWDEDTPEYRAFMARYRARYGHEPDPSAPVVRASLEMLQQAIERVGAIDRPAVVKELQTGTFDTVIGPLKLEGNIHNGACQVGQWQAGEFRLLGPVAAHGAQEAMAPKPAWQAR